MGAADPPRGGSAVPPDPPCFLATAPDRRESRRPRWRQADPAPPRDDPRAVTRRLLRAPSSKPRCAKRIQLHLERLRGHGEPVPEPDAARPSSTWRRRQETRRALAVAVDQRLDSGECLGHNFFADGFTRRFSRSEAGFGRTPRPAGPLLRVPRRVLPARARRLIGPLSRRTTYSQTSLSPWTAVTLMLSTASAAPLSSRISRPFVSTLWPR